MDRTVESSNLGQSLSKVATSKTGAREMPAHDRTFLSDQNLGLTAQGLIAAVFGFVFVCVLLVIAFVHPEPSPFQEFIYRVVMALAAGGIGAIIPGLLSFQSPWVKAGGAMACFAIVFFMNPPSLASQRLKSQAYADLMESGTTALARGNLTLAKQVFSAAIEMHPDAYLPWQRRADAQYDGGEFFNAKLDYQRAYEISKKAEVLYNAALCDEALKRYEDAIRTFQKIEREVTRDHAYTQDLRFSIAQLKLKIWLINRSDVDRYKEAVDGFRAYVESKQDPQYWAHYHLSCLYATQATTEVLSDEKKAQFITDASAELQRATAGISVAVSKKAEGHREMLRILLNGNADNMLPGSPVYCPQLKVIRNG